MNLIISYGSPGFNVTINAWVAVEGVALMLLVAKFANTK